MLTLVSCNLAVAALMRLVDCERLLANITAAAPLLTPRSITSASTKLRGEKSLRIQSRAWLRVRTKTSKTSAPALVERNLDNASSWLGARILSMRTLYILRSLASKDEAFWKETRLSLLMSCSSLYFL